MPINSSSKVWASRLWDQPLYWEGCNREQEWDQWQEAHVHRRSQVAGAKAEMRQVRQGPPVPVKYAFLETGHNKTDSRQTGTSKQKRKQRFKRRLSRDDWAYLKRRRPATIMAPLVAYQFGMAYHSSAQKNGS